MFFYAIEHRQFGRACDLLSEGFYRLNGVPSKKICRLGFTYGMSTAGIRYRIIDVESAGDRATVRALVDGVVGELLLVREQGAFKILSVGAR